MKNTRVLVVFYSRVGKTKALAERIAEKMNGDIEQIIDKKNRMGIHMMSSGRDAMKKVLADIDEVVKSPSDYGLVIVGTPVFSGRVSAPIRTYLMKNRDGISKVALFSTHRFRKKNHAIEDMKSILGKDPITTLEVNSRRDIKEGNYAKKVGEFIERIVEISGHSD